MSAYLIYFTIGNSLKFEKSTREFILYRPLNNEKMTATGYNLTIFKANKALGLINMKIMYILQIFTKI